MDKIKRIFLAMLFSVIAMCARAYNFEVDGIRYDVVSATGKTCEVTGISAKSYSGEEIVIPNSVSYKGRMLSVIRVAYRAFADSEITSVVIPNSVASIGRGAFYNCTNLTSVTLPNGIQSIEDDTFIGCKNLVSVTIPNNVSSG